MKYLFFIVYLFPIYSFSEWNLNTFQKHNEKKLMELSPKSNVIVIQRRYLYRTGRFELAPSLSFFLSSEFIINVGVGGSFGFNILEKHGLEIRGVYSAVIPRRVILDINRKLDFSETSYGEKTESFFGLVYKWFPIYGKMALFNRKIIPFDMYLMIGGGVSKVICTGPFSVSADALLRNCLFDSTSGGQKIYKKWELTSLMGIGQSFSMSRNTAVRLDIVHQLYRESKDNFPHTDITVTFAFSVFFPRARVR